MFHFGRGALYPNTYGKLVKSWIQIWVSRPDSVTLNLGCLRFPYDLQDSYFKGGKGTLGDGASRGGAKKRLRNGEF